VLNLSMSLFVQKGRHLPYEFKKFICGPVEFSPRAPVHYLSIRWRPMPPTGWCMSPRRA
jgi:hypothetical protein